MLAHETPGGAHCAAAIGLGYLHETIGTRSAPSVHQLTETVTSSAIYSIMKYEIHRNEIRRASLLNWKTSKL